MSLSEEVSVSTGVRIEEELESKLLSTGFEGKWVGKELLSVGTSSINSCNPPLKPSKRGERAI